MGTGTARSFAEQVVEGIGDELPSPPPDDPGVNRAPRRKQVLTDAEKRLALANALRYLPRRLHAAAAPELAAELLQDGRITMRRWRPHYAMHARPIDAYPAKSRQAAAIMLMVQNNLDPA